MKKAYVAIAKFVRWTIAAILSVIVAIPALTSLHSM